MIYDNILNWVPEIVFRKGEISETFVLLKVVEVEKITIEEADEEAERRLENIQSIYESRGEIMDCNLYYEMKEYIKFNLVDGLNLENYITSVIWLN